MIMMGIVTRKPDETKEMLTAVEDKALKLLPFLNRENIATIEQGTAGRCEYQLPFWAIIKNYIFFWAETD